MAGQKYNKAYEAYQQAVYRDGRNPTFWCSIGVLYFQINQFRDALDAYSRAIRINPYISEVWFDLGSLYESCNNQISDAIDAYARASELDPGNPDISRRLDLLKNAQATGSQLPAAPGPQDVHPTAYANTVVTAPGLSGPPLMLQPGHHRPTFRTDSRGPSVDGGLPLPPPSQVAISRSSPGPFRGGPPPPVILDESRHLPSHTPLAPMDVDQPRDYSASTRDGNSRGPVGHQSLLLHHPVPQQQLADDIRGGSHHQDSYFTRPRSVSPPSYPSRARSPPPPLPSYPASGRPPVGPGQPSQRSPRTYAHDVARTGPVEHWDRRPLPGDPQREWDRERRHRHSSDFPSHSSQPQHAYPPRSPDRAHSPPEHSPRSSLGSRGYWDSKPSGPPSHHTRGPSPAVHHEHHGRRYDPRYDARDPREYERLHDSRPESRSYAGSPELPRSHLPHHLVGNTARISTSPRPMPAPEPKERRRRTNKDKEVEAVVAAGQDVPLKKERRKRTNKRVKEEQVQGEAVKSFITDRNSQPSGPSTFANYGPQKGRSPEPMSASGSGSSNRSTRPSPSCATPLPPSRVVDEDYDEGVADSLIALASSGNNGPSQSPTISPRLRHKAASPRPPTSHRGSISSSRGHVSPPPGSSGSIASLKRPLTPGPDELPESKRTRVDEFKRRVSSESIGRRTPVPSSRPSPIPFRTQPSSRSPEARQLVDNGRPQSPPLPVLPPHPRPVGVLSLQSNGEALPPIATLSPASSAASPTGREGKSASPGSHSQTDVLHSTSRTSISPEATTTR
jgi:glucose repression mediator protein